MQSFDLDDDLDSWSGNSSSDEGSDIAIDCEDDIVEDHDEDLAEDNENEENLGDPYPNPVDLDIDLDLLKYQANWTNENYVPVSVTPFNQPEGCNLPPGFDAIHARPVDFFHLFFSNDLLSKFVEYTNDYADYRIAQKQQNAPNYVDQYWKEKLTLEEFKAWIGINIIFGLNPPKQTANCWSSNPFLENPGQHILPNNIIAFVNCNVNSIQYEMSMFTGVKRVFPLRRYKKINQFLHISQRNTEPGKEENYRQNNYYLCLIIVMTRCEHLISFFTSLQKLVIPLMMFCIKYDLVCRLYRLCTQSYIIVLNIYPWMSPS